MLIGYVSDENDSALSEVSVVLENDENRWSIRSEADGGLRARVAPGSYRAVLSRDGFGAKRATVDVREDAPLRLRLLSDRLVGFMWPKWVRAGETAEYRVHSPEAFRLDLFRYGWEREPIRQLGWCDEHGPRAMAQITPDGDYTQTGVDWNRVGYSLEYQKHGIAAPERSGLYFLEARTKSGEFFSFPWIVTPPKPEAKIAVTMSTISWNAYNHFGGRSNYFNQDGLPARPTVNARQDIGRYTKPDHWPYDETAAALSFERPELPSCVPDGARITDTIAGRMNSAFAGGEWRLLGWLEREGFAYDVYSETDLHFDDLPLDQYRVLILNMHPEYWTGEMYRRAQRWVEAGGRLMYLGGCAMYAEVDFVDRHTMLCRQEGRFDQRDGESAAKLLGVEYSHSGFQTGAPYRVRDGGDWVFADTGLKTGDLFGRRSLHERCPGGASAHELDKISPLAPQGLRHLAKGENPENSGADMTIYETPNGGAVFSAGSLCWTLSLPIDDGVSAVTANVLRRFLR